MIPKTVLRAAMALLAPLALLACNAPTPSVKAAAKGVVNVYSGRHYDADEAIYRDFTAKTGIEVRQLQAPGDELIERMKAEGAASPADVAITADAGGLWRLQQAGLLQPIRSAVLEAAIPARLRDPGGAWFAFSKRSRVIVYQKGGVDPALIQTYDSLAAPALKGKVCARSSTNVYNLSLMAARIARYGPEKALAWAKGVAHNFARDPQGADIDQIRAVAAGECKAALVNHYYLIRMAASPDPSDRATAAKVGLIFPDQNGAGAHVNYSGGGVAAHAQNKANAIALLEYLASPEAQALFPKLNEEFPVVAGVPLTPQLQALGQFKEDDLPLAAMGEHQPQAQALFDRAGWR